MKKFIAILLMMTMLFSCTAMAEITKDGTKTVMWLQINPMLIDTEDEMAAMLIDTLNAMTFTVEEGDEMAKLYIGANGVDFLETGLATDETGSLLVFSSLSPNVAVKYDLTKLAALINEALGEEMQAAMTEAMAAGEQLSTALMGYVEDVMALSAVLESAMVVDEAAGTAQLDITTHHVATLANAWITRLMQDETTLGMISMLMAMSGEENTDLASVLQASKAEMDDMLAAEPMVVGSVKAASSETGMKVEVVLMEMGYMYMDIAMTETGLTADVAMMIPDEVTAETTIEGIKNGTVPCTVLGIKYAAEGADEAAKIYMASAGTVFAVNMNSNTANPDTDAQVETDVVSLDLEMGENVLTMGKFSAVTTIVDAPVLPDLTQMYVYDVFAMPTDMVINGIPQFVEKITAALPEVVNMITEAFSGLGEVVITPTTPDAPAGNLIEDM